MQQEMIREIELARPKYLISVQITTSWLRRPESEELIIKWAGEYLKSYYNGVGFVNIVTAEQSDYYFEDLPKSVRQLRSYVLIYQRKT